MMKEAAPSKGNYKYFYTGTVVYDSYAMIIATTYS